MTDFWPGTLDSSSYQLTSLSKIRMIRERGENILNTNDTIICLRSPAQISSLLHMI